MKKSAAETVLLPEKNGPLVINFPFYTRTDMLWRAVTCLSIVLVARGLPRQHVADDKALLQRVLRGLLQRTRDNAEQPSAYHRAEENNGEPGHIFDTVDEKTDQRLLEMVETLCSGIDFAHKDANLIQRICVVFNDGPSPTAKPPLADTPLLKHEPRPTEEPQPIEESQRTEKPDLLFESHQGSQPNDNQERVHAFELLEQACMAINDPRITASNPTRQVIKDICESSDIINTDDKDNTNDPSIFHRALNVLVSLCANYEQSDDESLNRVCDMLTTDLEITNNRKVSERRISPSEPKPVSTPTMEPISTGYREDHVTLALHGLRYACTIVNGPKGDLIPESLIIKGLCNALGNVDKTGRLQKEQRGHEGKPCNFRKVLDDLTDVCARNSIETVGVDDILDVVCHIISNEVKEVNNERSLSEQRRVPGKSVPRPANEPRPTEEPRPVEEPKPTGESGRTGERKPQFGPTLEEVLRKLRQVCKAIDGRTVNDLDLIQAICDVIDVN